MWMLLLHYERSVLSPEKGAFVSGYTPHSAWTSVGFVQTVCAPLYVMLFDASRTTPMDGAYSGATPMETKWGSGSTSKTKSLL